MILKSTINRKRHIIKANTQTTIVDPSISFFESQVTFLSSILTSFKYVFKKLQSKGIILRSTEDGYNIKNKLRLTIGSKKENMKFITAIKSIFN